MPGCCCAQCSFCWWRVFCGMDVPCFTSPVEEHLSFSFWLLPTKLLHVNIPAQIFLYEFTFLFLCHKCCEYNCCMHVWFFKKLPNCFQSGHTFCIHTIKSSAYDPGSLCMLSSIWRCHFFSLFLAPLGVLWHMDFSLVVGGLSCPGVLRDLQFPQTGPKPASPWIGRWLLNPLAHQGEAPVFILFVAILLGM